MSAPVILRTAPSTAGLGKWDIPEAVGRLRALASRALASRALVRNMLVTDPRRAEEDALTHDARGDDEVAADAFWVMYCAAPI